MHDGAYLFDTDLEHAVSRRIGNHDRRQIGAVSLGLDPQIVQVDIAVVVAGDDDHLHARHVRRRRIGAMRRGWNEAHLAQRLSARGVIGLDHQKPGVFALRSRIGLQRHRRVTRYCAKHALEAADHFPITDRLVCRREGMQVRKLGPGHRHHFAGRVELHGAGPERDHRAVERDILVSETPQVAHHLGLRVIAIERRVGKKSRGALEARRQRVVDRRFERLEIRRYRALGRKYRPQQFDVLACGRLVERNADMHFINGAQIRAVGHCGLANGRGALSGLDRQRVEKRRIDHREPETLEPGIEHAR